MPTYERVAYRDVYPGIDLVYYGQQGQLEYDFVLAPGSRPRGDRAGGDWRRDGAPPSQRRAGVGAAGRGELRQPPPSVYQQGADASPEVVRASYAPRSDGHIGFAVAQYDASRPR